MNRLKKNFPDNERKNWQRHEYFFVNNPDKKLRLFQYLLGSVHSYSSHHFIWTSSWIDWKKNFVIMSAKIDNDMSIFFVNNPDQKFLLFQYLLGSVHSYTSPHFIWTSLWLDWKTLFVILHTDNIWAQSLTTTWMLSFRRQPRSKIPSISEPTRMITLLL